MGWGESVLSCAHLPWGCPLPWHPSGWSSCCQERRERGQSHKTAAVGKGGSSSRDLMRSNSKAHGSPSLDQREPPRHDWRGTERRAVLAISPAGIKWCYEWKPPNPGTRCRVKSRLLPSSGACTAPLPALGRSGEQACRGTGKKAKERGVEVVSPE